MSDPTLSGSVPGPVAADDAVERPAAAHLEHPEALAGDVRGGDLLGDHALGGVEPALGARRRRLLRRQRDRVAADVGEQALERGAALGERALEQDVVAIGEQVEGHDRGRRLARQQLDARGRRVDALLQRAEVLAAVARVDHDLAVEHVAARRQRELGEVAIERLAVARLQEHLVAVDERDHPEAVPLRLVHPLALGRQLGRGLRELGIDRRRERQRHCASGFGSGMSNPPASSRRWMRSSSGGWVSKRPPRLERRPTLSRSGDSM